MKIIDNTVFVAENKDSQEHLNRYVFAGKYFKERKAYKILDAGCSYGYGSFVLSYFVNTVIGVDISISAINNAQKNYPKENITFQTGDVTKLNFSDNYFDGIISTEVLEHLNKEGQESFFSNLSRIIKPSGTVIISTPDRFVGKPKLLKQTDHKNELTKKEFQILLEKYFKEVKLSGQFVLSECSPRLMFLKRMTLGIIKRVLRDPFLKWTRLHKFLNYKILPLLDRQTAAVLVAVCNKKR